MTFQISAITKSTTINYFNYYQRWIIDLVICHNSGGLFKKKLLPADVLPRSVIF